MKKYFNHWGFILILLTALFRASAQNTSITYQGRLSAASTAANGKYDFTFKLFNAAINGDAFAGLTNSALVTDGNFTVSLNFDPMIYNGGSNYWLEIAVKPEGGGKFQTLSPRQPLTPAPYAVHAATVDGAGIQGTIPQSSVTGTFDGILRLNNPNNAVAGRFSGDGSGLTNLPHADPIQLGSEVTNQVMAMFSAAVSNSIQVICPNNAFLDRDAATPQYFGQPILTSFGGSNVINLFFGHSKTMGDMITALAMPYPVYFGDNTRMGTNGNAQGWVAGEYTFVVNGNPFFRDHDPAFSADNVIRLRNANPARYSAVAFDSMVGTNSDGSPLFMERGAVGTANTNAQAGFRGMNYLESFAGLYPFFFSAGSRPVGGMTAGDQSFVWLDGNSNVLFKVNRLSKRAEFNASALFVGGLGVAGLDPVVTNGIQILAPRYGASSWDNPVIAGSWGMGSSLRFKAYDDNHQIIMRDGGNSVITFNDSGRALGNGGSYAFKGGGTLANQTNQFVIGNDGARTFGNSVVDGISTNSGGIHAGAGVFYKNRTQLPSAAEVGAGNMWLGVSNGQPFVVSSIDGISATTNKWP